MTTAPVQRVGLHELTQLLDGDMACAISDCEVPPTHVLTFTCCGITAEKAACAPHASLAVEKWRKRVADDAYECVRCNALLKPAHINLRPI